MVNGALETRVYNSFFHSGIITQEEIVREVRMIDKSMFVKVNDIQDIYGTSSTKAIEIYMDAVKHPYRERLKSFIKRELEEKRSVEEISNLTGLSKFTITKHSDNGSYKKREEKERFNSFFQDRKITNTELLSELKTLSETIFIRAEDVSIFYGADYQLSCRLLCKATNKKHAQRLGEYLIKESSSPDARISKMSSSTRVAKERIREILRKNGKYSHDMEDNLNLREAEKLKKSLPFRRAAELGMMLDGYSISDIAETFGQTKTITRLHAVDWGVHILHETMQRRFQEAV